MTATKDTYCTELHIGIDQTSVTSRNGTKSSETILLLIGSKKTATDFFKQELPTPIEMENAIMAVEDEVIRARMLVVQDSTLNTSDATIREIAQLADVPDNARMVLSVEAVERLFDLLAALVLGRPASRAGIPLDSGFAATLLILREFMHHLQFTSIIIVLAPIES